MSRRTGQVTAIKPGDHTVTVEFKRGNMCSHGSCSHRILPDTTSEVRVDAVDTVGVQLGDFVEVSFESKAALGAAFSVYILPILVGVSSYALAGTLSVPYPAVWALALAAGVMIIGLKKGNRLQTEYTVVNRSSSPFSQQDQQSCLGCPYH